MAKASRFYKQPKMKQKDYFETLERQKNLEYATYGEPRLLHQLKMQRGGNSIRRSTSDVSYNFAPLNVKQAPHYKQQNYPNHDNNNVKRSSSDVTYRQKRPKQIPVAQIYHDRNIYSGSSVQRSHSDSVRLVRYRDNHTNYTRKNYFHERPASVDLTRHRSAGHHDNRHRPASVDLTPRPRSILKKSSSASDLNTTRSYQQDLIFDEDYLDYVSPRDIITSNNNNQHTSDSQLNFSFEDDPSHNQLNHSRPISPKTIKRVNFNNNPTYFRSSATPRTMNSAESERYNGYERVRKGPPPQRNPYQQKFTEPNSSFQSLPAKPRVYTNGAAANGQPYHAAVSVGFWIQTII